MPITVLYNNGNSGGGITINPSKLPSIGQLLIPIPDPSDPFNVLPISTGLNIGIDESMWDEASQNPMIQERLDSGELEVIPHKNEGNGLLAYSPGLAKKVIATTSNLELLESWDVDDLSKSLRDTLRRRIQSLKAV